MTEITQKQIMQRARQLASLNHRMTAESGTKQWLDKAQKEAREGRTERWSFLSTGHEIRALKHQLVTLEYDRRTDNNRAHMDQLRDKISKLRAEQAAEPTEAENERRRKEWIARGDHRDVDTCPPLPEHEAA